MPLSRRHALALAPLLLASGLTPAWAAGSVTVAFAGSMGVVMDRGIAPAYTKQSGTDVHGIGQAAMALAHLITAKTLVADVFVPVSAGPVKVVKAAGLASSAVPVASTSIVLAYSPSSAFAKDFAAPGADWRKILTSPSLRFGRTDPQTDPQGQYVLYTLQLAEAFYHQPGFAKAVAGANENPAQIFAEPSLLARLQAGQIDATLGYKSAVISQHLPYIELPAAINFSSPAMAKDYAQAALTVKGKIMHPSPLVFYAMTLVDAPHPAAAADFVKFLASPAGQAIFAQYGYDPGQGPNL